MHERRVSEFLGLSGSGRPNVVLFDDSISYFEDRLGVYVEAHLCADAPAADNFLPACAGEARITELEAEVASQTAARFRSSTRRRRRAR